MDKRIFFGFVGLVLAIVYLSVFADLENKDIDMFEGAEITETLIEEKRALTKADERELHCQFGQLYFDGQYITADYDKAFFHFFLCGRTYSSASGRGDIVKITHKQYRPAFRSPDILENFETAKQSALQYVETSDLSSASREKVIGSINRSYDKALKAQDRTMDNRGFYGLALFSLVLLSFGFVASYGPL